MVSFETEKETIDSRNSLRCLIKGLVGTLVTVDLKNDCIITGVVEEVDGYMNILFSKAQLVDLDNSCYHYNTLYVKGRSIRFVQLPKEVNIRRTILNFLRKSSLIHCEEKSTAASIRHQKKLRARQEEIRKEVDKIKSGKK